MLDMREAYFQIMLDEESRDLTTFSDGVTLYRLRRLPFGLNSSPAIFSRRMASMLTPLLQKRELLRRSDSVGPKLPKATHETKTTFQSPL